MEIGRADTEKTVVLAATTDLATDQRLQRICSSLHANGWQVRLIGRYKQTSLPLPATVYVCERLRVKPEAGKLFYVFYNLKLFFRLLQAREGLFVSNDADTLPAVWAAAHLRRKKLVFDAHEYFSEVPEVVARPAIKAVWRWVERVFIPRVDVAYTVSPGLAEIFSTLYGKTFSVVLNVPYRAGKLPTRVKSDGLPILLYIGAINAGRGLEALLHAAAKLPVRLVLCGDGDLYADMQRLAHGLGLADKVTFTGRLSPQELKPYLAQAWLGYSSLEARGLSYTYSLANKFFDYIQAGLPQLCPALPEYVALLAQYPVGVPVEANEAAVTQAIQALLDDAGLYDALATATATAAAALCWEEEEKVLLALYAEQ